MFIRYHSGDGFGHVGWAFELARGLVDAGSVENHSGHIFTPAARMGFWNGCYADPVPQMREHGYDDVKWIEVEHADPLQAYRTVLWIEHEAYRALHRNCEDDVDVYDVLRAFGVQDLTLPSFIWFPKSWFKRFRGRLEHLPQYEWPGCDDCRDEDVDEVLLKYQQIEPWQPTWRRPWHPHFHALKLERFRQFLLRVERG